MRSVKEWNIKGRKYTLLHHNMKYQMRIDDQYTTLLLKLGDVDDSLIADIESKSTSPTLQGAINIALREASKCIPELFDALHDSDDLDEISII